MRIFKRLYIPVMRPATVLALAALATPLAWSPAFAQGVKIAYVDANVLVEQSPQSRRVEQELEAAFAGRQDELRARIEKFRAANEDFEKNALLLSEEERAAKARELQAEQREIQRTQRDFREDLDAERQRRIRELETLISAVVLEVSRSGGYDLVVQQAVYASPEIDITADVLERLKQHSTQ